MADELVELADAMYHGHEMLTKLAAEKEEQRVGIVYQSMMGATAGIVAGGQGSKATEDAKARIIELDGRGDFSDMYANDAEAHQTIETLATYSPRIYAAGQLLDGIYSAMPCLKPVEAPTSETP